MKAYVRASIAIFGSLSVVPLLLLAAQDRTRNNSREAPAAFDNETNGYLSQKLFDDFKETFEDVENIDDGLGPVFNDTSCANCHKTPVTGGVSEVVVTRAGRLLNDRFVEHPGGSLVHDKAIDPAIQEHLLPGEDFTFRASLSVLGDGFIEAIADDTIVDIAEHQSPDIRGLVIRVPVLEANNSLRVARFGWKNQHASLESFAADAYLNEMGITSPLQPVENTSDGRSVARYDTVRDPEDDGGDVRQFADFIRATKVPPRGPISGPADEAGQRLFDRIGCGGCHLDTIVTAPVGTAINGGTFRVPPSLGNMTIHPYSDFLLHDIGTSDPIVQNGGMATYDKVRTPPLWGLRTRLTHLMHDGQSNGLADAISRHNGQALRASLGFRFLSQRDRRALLTFLGSL
jgi:CxxC motif-containing protein (DUF1111 family)